MLFYIALGCCIVFINWIAKVFNPVSFCIKWATEQWACKRKAKIDKCLLNSHPQPIEILVYGISQQIAIVLVIGQAVGWNCSLQHYGCAIIWWR
ncbi:hypothetical protein HMPREF3138_23845 [Serratia sp. HMSC15F11]|nr:hypothetical protein HMPREF3138_23845 [Serratia sp. HMSC15F11]